MLSQQIINGFVAGSAYALFALGFTLMFGVLGVINLTYGFYFSAGAYIALFATLKGAPLALALPAAAIGAGRHRRRPRSTAAHSPAQPSAPELASLMVTLGATLFLYSGMTALFGSDIRRFPLGLIDSAPYKIGGATISATQILILGRRVADARPDPSDAGDAHRARHPRDGRESRRGGVDGHRYRAVMRRVSFISGALGGTAGVLIGLNTMPSSPIWAKR